MTNIVLNRRDFIKVLNIGGVFAGKNKVLPILDCVKIKVSGGRINVVSSDNQNSINKKNDVVEADGDVTFCVNCKELLSYIKLIGSENITLKVDENELSVVHEKGEMKLPTHNADDFPVIKPDDDSKIVTMDAALLNNWIVDARNFTSNDDLRPVMTGIYFYARKGELGCCGSDSKRLFSDFINTDIEDFEFTLNKSAFAAVCGICAESDSITIKIGERNVLFVGNNMFVLARMQERKYPNFKLVIPNDTPIKATINKEEFVNAIKRCKLSANQSSCALKLNFSGINLEIIGQDYDFNKKATENVMVQVNESISIGVNADLLLSVIEAIQTDNVIMEIKNPSTPCVLREDKENNKALLVVPMLVD